ncbi:hypothetical protein B9Z19DRAFT_1065678 [Tuber borchii]|uniref:Regulator of chromosome condensation 1/beta-lactamase-inhibitor protein II n=1 Tax=Tuber borchii TaxID=42251 RepID=A0A2T6ZQB3_TUBBO|nr:hypothetical protein B9Z19DRAFT_1065678 [Tuber borchii]
MDLELQLRCLHNRRSSRLEGNHVSSPGYPYDATTGLQKTGARIFEQRSRWLQGVAPTPIQSTPYPRYPDDAAVEVRKLSPEVNMILHNLDVLQLQPAHRCRLLTACSPEILRDQPRLISESSSKQPFPRTNLPDPARPTQTDLRIKLKAAIPQNQPASQADDDDSSLSSNTNDSSRPSRPPMSTPYRLLPRDPARPTQTDLRIKLKAAIPQNQPAVSAPEQSLLSPKQTMMTAAYLRIQMIPQDLPAVRKQEAPQLCPKRTVMTFTNFLAPMSTPYRLLPRDPARPTQTDLRIKLKAAIPQNQPAVSAPEQSLLSPKQTMMTAAYLRIQMIPQDLPAVRKQEAPQLCPKRTVMTFTNFLAPMSTPYRLLPRDPARPTQTDLRIKLKAAIPQNQPASQADDDDSSLSSNINDSSRPPRRKKAIGTAALSQADDDDFYQFSSTNLDSSGKRALAEDYLGPPHPKHARATPVLCPTIHDQSQSSSSKPARSGQRWTHQEDDRLSRGHRAGLCIDCLATNHERTYGAIRQRIWAHTTKRIITPQRLDLYVFGTGDFGELGLGPDIQVARVPRFINHPPRHMAGIVDVAVGGMHTLALTHDGHIYSWGVNDLHCLGRETGSPEPSETPALIKGFPVQTVITNIAAGD